jgi:CpeT protein
MMLGILRLLVVIIAATNVALGSISTRPDDVDVQELSTWFEGSYSSEKQANVDTTYANERLEIRRIWLDRTDGTWFVVERFLAARPDMPLQQSVMNVRAVEDNITEIRVYVWKSPENGHGIWKNPERAGEYGPSDLRLMRGCEMYFQRNATTFFGGTHGTACRSEVTGTSYESHSMSISAMSIALWVRGYTAENKQVFGSLKGPYYYLKQKP